MITLNCVRLMIRYSFQSYFLQRSIYLCRTYKFITNYFSHCAVWILCVISLERAAVTRRIVWNQNVFNHKHSYCTLVVIYTILFFLNIHYLIFFGWEEKKADRHGNNHSESRLRIMCSSNLVRPPAQPYDYFLTFYFSWMDFIINSLVPFIIILIANASVVYSVCRSRLLMKQLGIRQTRSPRDTQLAYILFVSTFLFLLLTFPLRVFSVVEPYLTYEKKYLILSDGIMRFLLYLDHGCGFYLYTFTGELFRRELKKFLYDFLFVLFRRRFFHWSSIESRRHSELSGSNGVSHAMHSQNQPQQQGSLLLHDSTSSCGAMKNSAHSLQQHRLPYHTSYHRCAYARPHTHNSFTAPSTRSRLGPVVSKQYSLDNTNQTGLVKRHSSSCFEADYKTNAAPLTSPSHPAMVDLDRKSDIL